MNIKGGFRHPRFPRVVRYFVRVHTQEREVLHRSPREIHPLEVRYTLVYRSRQRNLTRGSRHRQTVFYTPKTITISEGQKIRGKLSCAPNTKNNRDLDIKITYETEGVEKETVDYKMCVVFPSFGAATPRLVNSADRWSGANCIFLCMFSCLVVLTCRKSHIARVRLSFDDPLVARCGACTGTD